MPATPRVVHLGSAGSPYGRAVAEFVTAMSAAGCPLTSGPPSAARSESQVLGDVASGVLAGAVVTNSAMALVHPGFEIADLPYLFDGPEAVWRYWQAPGTSVLRQAAAARGCAILAHFDGGSRQFLNAVRPVREPADLRGLRIRVLPGRVHSRWIEALGGRPIEMDPLRFAAAQPHDLVDGAERSYLNIRDMSLADWAPHISPTSHSHLSAYLVCSLDWLSELTSTQRAAAARAARAAEGVERALYAESDARARRSLLASPQARITEVDIPEFHRVAGRVREGIVLDRALRGLYETACEARCT